MAHFDTRPVLDELSRYAICFSPSFNAKNEKPFQRVPVISEAILLRELYRRSSYLKPSASTLTDEGPALVSPGQQRARLQRRPSRLPLMAPTAVRRSAAVSFGPKSFGARIRRSASLAISIARRRARSDRPPSAIACRRQAIRRNRKSLWWDPRVLPEHFPVLPPQAANAQPAHVFNLSQNGCIHHFSPVLLALTTVLSGLSVAGESKPVFGDN